MKLSPGHPQGAKTGPPPGPPTRGQEKRGFPRVRGGWNPTLRGRLSKVSGPRSKGKIPESENANGPLSHEMALELVCGADFWCNRHCRTSPVVLEGFWGQVWPKIGRKPTRKLRIENQQSAAVVRQKCFRAVNRPSGPDFDPGPGGAGGPGGPPWPASRRPPGPKTYVTQ